MSEDVRFDDVPILVPFSVSGKGDFIKTGKREVCEIIPGRYVSLGGEILVTVFPTSINLQKQEKVSLLRACGYAGGRITFKKKENGFKVLVGKCAAGCCAKESFKGPPL